MLAHCSCSELINLPPGRAFRTLLIMRLYRHVKISPKDAGNRVSVSDPHSQEDGTNSGPFQFLKKTLLNLTLYKKGYKGHTLSKKGKRCQRATWYKNYRLLNGKCNQNNHDHARGLSPGGCPTVCEALFHLRSAWISSTAFFYDCLFDNHYTTGFPQF